MSGSFDDKVVLVTGASRGIGRAVARAFAREGAHVIAVARTVGGLEELDDEIREMGGSATLVPLSLDDGPGIDRLGGAVFERWKRLDVLIGNAGLLGSLTPLAHIDPKEWDQVLAINLTANWRLIRALDPLLRQADAGRAIFVTSGVARHPRAYWATYAISKAALEAMVRVYAAEIAKSTVRANLINPGPTRTAMRAKAMPGEDPETLPPPEALEGAFLKLASAEFTENGVLYDAPSKKIVRF
ncbi:MAG TPA: SDR family NAD(P)-dependent oxidoreductase [Hyphomicrobiales bacterium]|nr:SDR family NAD(P)-dependent oxidoreductase [Hyphomicrobiales bacterium]